MFQSSEVLLRAVGPSLASSAVGLLGGGFSALRRGFHTSSSQAEASRPGDKPPASPAALAEIDAFNSEMSELFGEAFVPPASPGDPPVPGGLGGTPPTASNHLQPPPTAANHLQPPPTASNHLRPASTASQPRPEAPSGPHVLVQNGPGDGDRLTHVDESGTASMVDVAKDKVPTTRTAVASALVRLGPVAYELVEQNRLKKGDVLTVAQIAGIMGAKSTADLIPLCHNIFLSKVDVQLTLDAHQHAVRISAMARTVGTTGVEMEALTGASVAALTVYDMCKAVTKDIVITNVQLEHKSGGKSGDFTR